MFEERTVAHVKQFVHKRSMTIFDLIDYGNQKMVIVAGLGYVFVLSFRRETDTLVKGVQFYITSKKEGIFALKVGDTIVELAAEIGIEVIKELLQDFLEKIIVEEQWL